MGTRPAIFKWRQTEPGLILCAVRWYLRYSLSLRDVEELLEERGLHVDHTTVWRWVQRYGLELEQRLRRHLKPTNKSWRVDETYAILRKTEQIRSNEPTPIRIQHLQEGLIKDQERTEHRTAKPLCLQCTGRDSRG